MREKVLWVLCEGKKQWRCWSWVSLGREEGQFGLCRRNRPRHQKKVLIHRARWAQPRDLMRCWIQRMPLPLAHSDFTETNIKSWKRIEGWCCSGQGEEEETSNSKSHHEKDRRRDNG